MKDLEGYDGAYAILEDGRVWAYPKTWVSGNPKLKRIIHSHNGKFLSQQITPPGYPWVNLVKNGKRNPTRIHVLLARAYIPNPLNLSQVNHKNGNKSDYRLENLEWCTASENIRHAIRTGLRNYERNGPTISGMARRHGLKPYIVFNRLGKKWTLDAALNTPVLSYAEAGRRAAQSTNHRANRPVRLRDSKGRWIN